MKVADQYISVKISETGAEVSVKSTMQHLYEKYDKQAGTEYGDDVLDQSEIVDAKETGFAAFKNAVQEYHVLGEIVKPSIKSIIEEAINEVDESSED
jgi:hypothetical protein